MELINDKVWTYQEIHSYKSDPEVEVKISKNYLKRWFNILEEIDKEENVQKLGNLIHKFEADNRLSDHIKKQCRDLMMLSLTAL